MDVLFSITNLKSVILFIHLAGLAIGLGGSWILDVFILKHLPSNTITRESFDLIKFVAKFVMTGLILLWVSGLAFLGYYILFSPDLLANPKVWAKLLIVCVLTINGFYIHKTVLPKLKASIGRPLLLSLSPHEVRQVGTIGIISFISWLFPVVLGVAKALNFVVPAAYIILAYLACLAVVYVIMIITSFIMMPPSHQTV